MVADGTAAMGLAFFYEMDRRIRDMQARGIQPCDPSADVYTPAGLKALEHWRALCAHLQALNHVTVENAALRAERASFGKEVEAAAQQVIDSKDAEIAALRAENAQLRELMNLYNLGGWTDSLALMKERDALRARVAELVECVKHSTEYRIGHPSFERAVARATESAGNVQEGEK